MQKEKSLAYKGKPKVHRKTIWFKLQSFYSKGATLNLTSQGNSVPSDFVTYKNISLLEASNYITLIIRFNFGIKLLLHAINKIKQATLDIDTISYYQNMVSKGQFELSMPLKWSDDKIIS